MPEKNLSDQNMVQSQVLSKAQVSRRNFLSYAGLSATAMVAVTACSKREIIKIIDDINDDVKDVVYLGSGDIGILNYAYALEQLEAEFYIKVTSSFYSGITSKERLYLEDIRDHEIAHREFFKKALADKAIQSLRFDFSSIDFSNRTSVLATARAFEDLGVSAYNGAGELLENPTYLLLAGKIVSVEARHAAAIRDLINYGSFADPDVVNAQGLDVVRKPPEVLAIADKYIVNKIVANNLPTS